MLGTFAGNWEPKMKSKKNFKVFKNFNPFPENFIASCFDRTWEVCQHWGILIIFYHVSMFHSCVWSDTWHLMPLSLLIQFSKIVLIWPNSWRVSLQDFANWIHERQSGNHSFELWSKKLHYSWALCLTFQTWLSWWCICPKGVTFIGQISVLSAGLWSVLE